ncbi:MAG: hypothetical protein LBJ23_02540 [Tannerella sp.]|jgi:hypothetical protein|nr:hypothetical protein [Tannerella sp.]
MARRKITNSQAICIILLWGILCYLLLTYGGPVDAYTIFILIASGIVVFVPLYKNRRRPGGGGRK